MDFDKLVDTTKTITGADGSTFHPPKRKAPVPYVSRRHSGNAVVVRGYNGATGPWVTLRDTKRGAEVTIRPSQVTL